MTLDLETLKYVEYSFRIHNDHSTRCNGYRALCKLIDEIVNSPDKSFEVVTDTEIKKQTVNEEILQQLKDISTKIREITNVT